MFFKNQSENPVERKWLNKNERRGINYSVFHKRLDGPGAKVHKMVLALECRKTRPPIAK